MTHSNESSKAGIQNPKVVILLGPPGAGKGTQAELISQKLNLFYFETSKLLEERYRNMKEGEYVEADGQKYYLADERKKWEGGELNSFPFVTKLVIARFAKLHEEGKGLLLAGSPRSLYEAEKEMAFLEAAYGKQNIHVIILNISEETTIERNTKRRICELMRHPILSNEETKSLAMCPLDGSKLIKRERLDDPSSIKVRLQEYRTHTFPIIEYIRAQGFQVHEVDGSGSAAQVFSHLMAVLQEQ